ncbi:MAG TPA: SDR family NAD(P)-dependent oxidoreductase, partial [Candidatus Ozemobacteraceae bacterium]|nr:SDR family NAD(P)-dependent oxidoreductase [Candidatus Ozemobacteraceae bacterium]
MNVLVTGAAGFIGYHVSEKLLARGDTVVGFDNVNDYYEVSLKEARLARLTGKPGFRFVRADLADKAAVDRLFAEHRFDRVIHLAAQAGVRYSLEHPEAYVEANLVGFVNIL